MKTAYNFLLSLGIIALPTLAWAAPQNFQALAYTIVGILNNGALLLITFGLVVYFWGIASNIGHFGDEKGQEKLKSYFFWGIIIFFVMVSLWGIVNLLQSTLFGGDTTSPSPSQSSIIRV